MTASIATQAFRERSPSINAAAPIGGPVQSSVSVAIIARNEAQAIGELLPLLSWAQEVVVLVDADTTDETAEVARRLGAQVAVRPLDDFASQRNAALELCRGNWVLSLDADERPTDSLAAEVQALLPAARCTAYRLRIRSTIFGRRVRFCGTQDDWPVRLFRRELALWHGAVHERLVVAGPVGRLRHGLTHHTLPDLQSFLRKMHQYTALEVQQRLAEGRGPWRGQRWWAAAREFGRRLIWKHGWLDGPTGWLFCGLSGLSAWVAADRLRRTWHKRSSPSGGVPGVNTTLRAGGKNER